MSRMKGGMYKMEATRVTGLTPGNKLRKEGIQGKKPAPVG
jgi:hypothetical protein